MHTTSIPQSYRTDGPLEGLDILVCSYGGVGTSALIDFLSKYKRVNEVADTDGLKHLQHPPEVCPKNLKVIYVFGDPISATISLFHRNFSRRHVLKLHPTWDRDELLSLDSLEVYAKNKADLFHFEDIFSHWTDTNRPYSILFIKYEHLWDNISAILAFAGIPQTEIAQFPPKKERYSNILREPDAVQKGLTAIYGPFSEKVRALPDIFTKDPVLPTMQPGISVICACKNRFDTLNQSIDSWLFQKMIQEIILVDWDSRENIEDILRKDSNGKITLVRVLHEPYWELSRAYNLAAQFATKETLLKLDCDYVLSPHFFNKHTIPNDKVFYRGNIAQARETNEKYLTGALFVSRKRFFEVRGYNEFIYTYGMDDVNISAKLEQAGCRPLNFDYDHIRHIPHPNKQRIKYQRGVISTDTAERKNSLRIKKMSWLNTRHMTQFRIINHPYTRTFIVQYDPVDLTMLKIRRFIFSINPKVSVIYAVERTKETSNAIMGKIGIHLKAHFPRVYHILKKWIS